MIGKRILTGAGILFVLLSCVRDHGTTSTKAIRDAAIMQTYPKLYKAVFQRDARKIVAFTADSSAEVRTEAWRALAQTPVDFLDSLIDKVKESKSPVAWFALSMHKLSAKQRRTLEREWMESAKYRRGISLVLGKQGDAQALHFLTDHRDVISGSSFEAEGALAVGRLMTRFPMDKKQQGNIIDVAFSTDKPNLIRNWLYAFYRGSKTKLLPSLRDTLYQKWKAYGVGKSHQVDQYMSKILATDVFAEIIQHYYASKTLQNNVQLGIELAKAIPKVDVTSSNREAVKALLRQPNPHVQQLALEGLTKKLKPGDPLLSFIKKQFIANDSTTPLVWLQALNLVGKSDSTIISTRKKRLSKIGEHDPYLYPKVLKLWMKADNPKSFLNRVDATVGHGDPLKSMYAINALHDFWSHTDRKKRLKPQVCSIIFQALAKHDRSITYSVQPLLRDSVLFDAADFPKINSYLKAFSLPGDIEVYQSFGSLYKDRFEKQARPMIDSLAALNYAPLNRSLKQSGWDVSAPEKEKPKFRVPHWDRLWELGRHPVWVLETAKGTIKVQMNTLSAPATVSAIDSLTRAGAYNGVPFHRVVHNFVIQGGDIERRDGFGGPDFVIPTEASEKEFTRGAAGIASAGPDTEGSQYFFMNQWSPHLDGGYTLFGEVIDGIDVVDRIIVGDKVEKAYWE